MHDGTWGFAAGVDLTPEAAARVAEQAVAVARVSRPVNRRADRAGRRAGLPGRHLGLGVRRGSVHGAGRGQGRLLADWSERLLAADGVDHVDAAVQQVLENKFYADLAGTRPPSSGSGCTPSLDAVGVDQVPRPIRDDAHARAAGRPRLGVRHRRRDWDWAAELAELPELAGREGAAPSVEAGRYDLVVDPSNLWLTIHESIGHATELDRALGYEAAYAGTSFATFDKLGTLRYGSAGDERDGDRTAEHGPVHDRVRRRGRAAQPWDLVTRRRPRRLPARPPDGPSHRAWVGPTDAPLPTRPATSRSSGWPTCRCSRRRTARRPRT